RPFGWLMLLDLFEQGGVLRLDAVLLLVQVSRVQPEALVLRREGVAGLGDAALAENQRLLALGEGLANDRPFFERVFQHGEPPSESPAAKIGACPTDREKAGPGEPALAVPRGRGQEAENGEGEGRQRRTENHEQHKSRLQTDALKRSLK